MTCYKDFRFFEDQFKKNFKIFLRRGVFTDFFKGTTTKVIYRTLLIATLVTYNLNKYVNYNSKDNYTAFSLIKISKDSFSVRIEVK